MLVCSFCGGKFSSEKRQAVCSFCGEPRPTEEIPTTLDKSRKPKAK